MLGFVVALLLQADEPVDFKRDIRPILSNTCFLCHGPDPKNRKGDLRLDIRGDAFRVVDGKAAFVPGKPDKSEALLRILTTDKDDHMPPVKSGKKLTPKQIELIRKWVQQGAKWSEHWSFVPPERPPVPEVKGAANPVDAFVRVRLDREGLAPSPEAGRETLLRRLSLDLVGLPPTAGEIETFAERDVSLHHIAKNSIGTALTDRDVTREERPDGEEAKRHDGADAVLQIGHGTEGRKVFSRSF
jgi:hypothetical protein